MKFYRGRYIVKRHPTYSPAVVCNILWLLNFLFNIGTSVYRRCRVKLLVDNIELLATRSRSSVAGAASTTNLAIAS